MVSLSDRERRLLERLADEGKRTRLKLGELQTAKSLEADGLVFMIGETLDAIITPKEEKKPKRGKPPSSLLE